MCNYQEMFYPRFISDRVNRKFSWLPRNSDYHLCSFAGEIVCFHVTAVGTLNSNLLRIFPAREVFCALTCVSLTYFLSMVHQVPLISVACKSSYYFICYIAAGIAQQVKPCFTSYGLCVKFSNVYWICWFSYWRIQYTHIIKFCIWGWLEFAVLMGQCIWLKSQQKWILTDNIKL